MSEVPDDVVIFVAYDPSEMPDPAEVEELYARAAALPPLNESNEVARAFAGLYRHSREKPGAVVVAARRERQLVGFAYGHSWSWGRQQDDWSQELRRRLGVHAETLEDSFAVPLIAVTPRAAGVGLGRLLLTTLLHHDSHAVAWLQTTDCDSPARRLYERTGWVPLGHGPDAPNGTPGLVMVRHAI